MNNDLDINSPILFEFRAGLAECIKAMLTTMVDKGAHCGSITAQLGFEIRQKTVTDEESGEVITVYVPNIEHKIKGKIGFESGNIKGTYKGKDIALCGADGSWSLKNISGQTSLF